MWNNGTPTGAVDAADTSAVNLGLKFQANASGYITGVRFYKQADNTGTHTGALWSATGTLLANGTFTAETGGATSDVAVDFENTGTVEVKRGELGLAEKQGKRYSWGYPAIPDLDDHQKVFKLLPAEKDLGMQLSPAGQLIPEQSTAAIIVHHAKAKYYSVGESRVDQLMKG